MNLEAVPAVVNFFFHISKRPRNKGTEEVGVGKCTRCTTGWRENWILAAPQWRLNSAAASNNGLSPTASAPALWGLWSHECSPWEHISPGSWHDLRQFITGVRIGSCFRRWNDTSTGKVTCFTTRSINEPTGSRTTCSSEPGALPILNGSQPPLNNE
jgi:hypothetical protein